MSNVTLSKIICKNEEEANRTAANVMLTTFVLFTLIYILNVLGIFVIDKPVMTAAYLIGAVFLLLPAILNGLCGTSAKYLKYLYVLFADLFLLLTKRTSKLLSEDADNYEHLVCHNQEMICGFATIVENRDENTGGHIKRTSVYAELLARELQQRGKYTDILTDEFIECLATVAPLHDIGKVAVPDNILCKPGKLTDEKFEIMKSHSVKGGKIIREVFIHSYDEYYREMAYDVARYHHEKWNGKGYPEGLSGNDIPLAARIMSVADVFDAVSEKRCYRDAMPMEKCFEIISEGSGRDFDPILAEAFLNIREIVIEARENSMVIVNNSAGKVEELSKKD